MFKEGLGQNKVLFGSQRGRTTNGQTAIAGSLTLPAPGRQISGFLPASDSIENQIDSDPSILPHLACFVARLFGCRQKRGAETSFLGEKQVKYQQLLR